MMDDLSIYIGRRLFAWLLDENKAEATLKN